MQKFVLLALAALLTACSAFPLQAPTPSPAAVSPTSRPPAPPLAQTSVTPTPAGPTTLRVWLPPQFDPGADTPAGHLLSDRLKEFASRRPEVQIEARVKAVDGPGGLLDSLTSAAAAAPLALPDLTALPQPALETAATRGLIHPFDPASVNLEDGSWYDYARQLAKAGSSSIFGLPFAGDALILIYRTPPVREAPRDWAAALKTNGPLAFPAADPQALFTLAQYQAMDGPVRDDQGRPSLDLARLTDLLTFYQKAEKAGIMPFWLTQLAADDQTLASYKENKAVLAGIPFTLYLTAGLTTTNAAQLLTPDGRPHTLATGWAWTVTAGLPERQEQAAELGRFLTEPDFLGAWSEAARVLPTRPEALRLWGAPASQAVAEKAASSAGLMPGADILNSLGGVLTPAVIAVLKQQADPAAAAQTAIQKLKKP
jgi:maltose-binding protein MalE